jgi:hypothetical protein
MYYTTTFTVFYPLHQRKKPFPRHICVGAMAICSFRTSTSSSTGPLRELLPLVRKSPVGVISLIPIRGIEVVLTNRAEENGWNDPYPTSFYWHRWRHRWESSHHGTNLTWHFTKSHGCRLCSYGSPEVEGFFPTKKKTAKPIRQANCRWNSLCFASFYPLSPGSPVVYPDDVIAALHI